MRDLYAVINQLLEVIPDIETSLRLELKNIQRKLLYAAPETQGYQWLIAARVLEANTLDRDDSWIKVTQSIFNGKTPNETTLPQTNLPTQLLD
jgi:hypothetical protein